MDKHYGFIYLTIDLKNGKGYVGQHIIKNQKTLDPLYIGSGKIIRDILKGNGNNKSRFHRQILCLCENQEELDKMEVYYIDYFNAIESENFYNCAEGGKGGNKMAGLTNEKFEEWRNKKIISMRKHYENEENRKKQSETCKKAFNKPEVKKKRSEANKKRLEDPKEREKCASHGEKNPISKKCYCNELNIIFSYVKLGEKYCINILNSKIGPIRDVCNKKRNYTGKLQNGTKLTWNWLEDVDEETLKNAIYIDDEKYNELLSKM